ncbi:MAG: putative toxin-antitoxin system toxin component, PIN family [Rhodospirillales bacterium]
MNYPPRVVIDANLHFSSFIGRGSPVHALHRAWLEHLVRPLVSPDILADTEIALRKKKLNLPEAEITRFWTKYEARYEILTPPAGLPVPQCRDPRDQCYLDLAYMAKADALISGDKDLRSMAGDFSVPILTAGDFMERFL